MVLEIILEKNREELMMEAWHVLRKDKEGLLPHLLFLWLQPSKFFRAGRHCPPTWKPHKCSILINHFLSITRASLVTQVVKNLPAIWKTWVPSLGWEDLLEKRSATYSSILVWRIPWTEEPGRLLSTGSQRVRRDWATFTFTYLSFCLSLNSFWAQRYRTVVPELFGAPVMTPNSFTNSPSFCS